MIQAVKKLGIDLKNGRSTGDRPEPPGLRKSFLNINTISWRSYSNEVTS
jgi:hypothetical protein